MEQKMFAKKFVPSRTKNVPNGTKMFANKFITNGTKNVKKWSQRKIVFKGT